jgi:hypothetical protein
MEMKFPLNILHPPLQLRDIVGPNLPCCVAEGITETPTIQFKFQFPVYLESPWEGIIKQEEGEEGRGEDDGEKSRKRMASTNSLDRKQDTLSSPSVSSLLPDVGLTLEW